MTIRLTSLILGCLSVTLAGCSAPAPSRLADAIRADTSALVSGAAVRHADSGDDYVEVTLRAGASAEDAHRLWCATVVPNGGISEYDDPASGTYVDTLDSTGSPLVFSITCP
jgi:hypothetical protein